MLVNTCDVPSLIRTTRVSQNTSLLPQQPYQQGDKHTLVITATNTETPNLTLFHTVVMSIFKLAQVTVGSYNDIMEESLKMN